MNSWEPAFKTDFSAAKTPEQLEGLRRVAEGFAAQGYCWVRSVQLAFMAHDLHRPSYWHAGCETCTKKVTPYLRSLLVAMADATDWEIGRGLDSWLDVVAGHEHKHLRRYARLRRNAPGFRTRPNKDGRHESNHHRIDIGLLERHFAWFGGTDTECQHCGDRFIDATKGRPAIHCSKACKQAAYRERKRQQRYETMPESG